MFDDQARLDAHTYARSLTVGAEASGLLEVHKVVLSRKHLARWESRRYTLDQQVPVGAFAHILQTGGRRWIYTTTRGRVQIGTLERWSPRWPIELIAGNDKRNLADELEMSLLDAMEDANPDRRSRRCTMRGFDGQAALDRWIQTDRFEQIAAGREVLTRSDDISAYLDWWETQISREEQRRLRGLPVTERIHQVARDAGLAEHFRLVVVEALGYDTSGVPTLRQPAPRESSQSR